MIEIFQTMKWTKSCWHESFKEKILLNDILPKKDSRYPSHFDINEREPNPGEAQLLWMPPHSELNGWNERPSEILKSFVITAQFEKDNYDFQIVETMPLIQVIEQQNIEEEFRFPIMVSSDSPEVEIFWQGVKKPLMAHVGKYLFILGFIPETRLEAILEQVGSELHLVFHSESGCHEEAWITRKALKDSELEVFQNLIARAEELKDLTDIELTETEIQGAKYY